MEKHAEREKDTQPLSAASSKNTRRGKKCAAFGCSNIFYDTEETATGMHFLGFLTDLRN